MPCLYTEPACYEAIVLATVSRAAHVCNQHMKKLFIVTDVQMPMFKITHIIRITVWPVISSYTFRGTAITTCDSHPILLAAGEGTCLSTFLLNKEAFLNILSLCFSAHDVPSIGMCVLRCCLADICYTMIHDLENFSSLGLWSCAQSYVSGTIRICLLHVC